MEGDEVPVLRILSVWFGASNIYVDFLDDEVY
jgi:hypothetical protein